MMSLDSPDVGDILATLGIAHAMGLDYQTVAADDLIRVLPSNPHPIFPWRLPGELESHREWLPAVAVDELLSIASSLGQQTPFRIELLRSPTWCQADWLARTIGTAHRIQPRSVYLYHDTRPQPLLWQWPLRVGFLDDSASRLLHERLVTAQSAVGGWRQKNARLDRPQEDPSRCGIIVVPSFQLAQPRLFDESRPLQCGACLILNWDQESGSAGIFSRYQSFLDQSWCNGIAAVDVGVSDSEDLFFHFMQSLSHNLTFDAALVEACHQLNLAYPFVLGSTTLMRDSRLSRMMARIGRSLESSRAALGDDLLGDDSAPSPIEDEPGSRGDSLESGAREYSADMRSFEVYEDLFASESDYSTDMADLAEEVEAAMDDEQLESLDSGPRFLQCQIRAADETIVEHFVAGSEHVATVRVGVPETGWLQPSEDFPVAELPAGRDKYHLTVAFAPLASTAASSEPVLLEIHEITLPAVRGNSTAATFTFSVPSDETSFEARILVLFENRILQTGRLHGTIAPADAEVEATSIHFEIESLVSRYFSGLQGGTRFGHALFFNHNEDGGIGLTSATDGEVTVNAPAGMADQVAVLNNLVSTMAFEPDTFSGGLDQNNELLEYMIAFARTGADLRSIIEAHIPPGNSFDSRQPIQILTKTMGEKIPIEFLYDYEAPVRAATLCPAGLANLPSGKCDGQHDENVFCPTGFWGVNRVIERHAYQPNATGHGFVLRNEPTASRRAISIGNQSVFAGTKVVDDALGGDHGLCRVKNELDLLTDTRCQQVSSWREWRAVVGSNAPGLLVLVVHTERESPPFSEQKMEIGHDKWLLYGDIREDLVGVPDPGPLVFLIGCKTGDDKISYRTLSEKFKRHGAAVVVSSTATIHSRHAIPVLERMIKHLREQLGHQPAVVGEIMRRMRSEMLAEGIPIIFCLTAYGDADWVLT